MASKSSVLVSKTLLGLLFAFVILLLGAVFYLVINQGKGHPSPGNIDEDSDIAALKSYKAPLGNLPTYRGSKMVKAYLNQFTTQAGTGQSYPSTGQPEIVSSVYFDFPPLFEYIRKMKNRYHASGVRIYFAKYDSTEMRTIYLYPNKPDTEMRDLKGYCTVVICPTRREKDGSIVDDLVTKVNGKDSLVHLLDQPVDLFKLGTQVMTQPQNAGISCPPYPPYVCGGQLLLNYAQDSLSFLGDKFNWAEDNY